MSVQQHTILAFGALGLENFSAASNSEMKLFGFSGLSSQFDQGLE